MNWMEMLNKYGPKAPYNYDTLVLPEGPAHAKMVLVGEAPGEEETWHKPIPRPFVGSAGKLLDKMLSEAGINRSECLILNTSWERPDDNKFQSHFYTRETKPVRWVPTERLKKWRLLLRRLLAELQPYVVVAFGNEPLQALLGVGAITKRRGSIYHHQDGYKIVPTVHSAAVLRGWKMRSLVIFDLERAKKESLTRQYTEPSLDLDIDPEYVDVINYLDWIIENKISTTIDLETRADHIACLGIGHKPDYALVIPFMRTVGHYWRLDREAQIICRLAKILTDPDIPVDGQNFFSFDAYIFWQEWGIVPQGIDFDTMHAQHLLYPERFGVNMGLGLAHLTSLFTDPVMNYYKDEGKVWEKKIGEIQFWKYCGKDVCATRQVRQGQETELQQRSWPIKMPTTFGYNNNTSTLKDLTQADFYNNFTRRLSTCLLDLQVQGIKIDLTRQSQLYTSNKQKINWMQSVIDETVTEGTLGHITSLNVRSAPQMKNLLYNYWNLPRQYKRVSGRKTLTCDEDALNKLKTNNPELQPFFDFLLKQKEILQEQNFLKSQAAPDGRMRTVLSVSGTETGRLASRTPPCGFGTNFQNVKNRLRQIFIADEGMDLYAVDSSQAEARVVAVLAQQWDLVDLLQGDLDVHWETAKRIFKLPTALVYDATNVEHYRMRYISKRVIHASNYGMSWYRFKQMLLTDAGIDLTKQEAEALLEAYHKIYPNIRRVFHQGVVRKLRVDRELHTCFGRGRIFYDRWPTSKSGGELFRKAYAYVPQSTVGDLVNHALVDFHDWSKTTMDRVQVLHQNHDEILYQSMPSMARAAGQKVQELMTRTMVLEGYELSIPVEFMKGKNWGYKTGENPHGLVEWNF
jgi:uracil-DNA glycosylase family 4